MKDNKIKKWLKEFLYCFAVMFLMAFMFFIFGPAEIFFTNVQEFEFVYSEFSLRLVIYGLIFSVLGSVILSVIPQIIRKILIAIVFALSISGYLQVMFFNKDLDLLGVNPEGYVVEKQSGLINLAIWLVLIVTVIVFSIVKEDICKKVICYVSVCILLVQAVAFSSLFIQADESAFEHSKEGEWYLSGEKQYTVSANKNIIVLVLDYFSNQYLEQTIASNKYPDLLDGMKDFTYYNNADCAYFGTFPSMTHMFTGQEVDPSILINDWTGNAWTDEKVLSFYSDLREKNYEINMYTTDANVLCGSNDKGIMSGVFDNLSNAGQDLIVDYERLEKTMLKLSAFRLLPDMFKSKVYVQISEYQDIVQQRENKINHNNYVFYENIVENGLSLEEDKNCVIIEHLMGTHIFDTSEDCHYKPDVTMEETVKGCMVLVDEYISQLKKLGVYDDATIIITADHGSPRDSQVVFWIKEAGEQHDEMIVREAPISLCDLLPTIGKAAGISYEQMGRAVSDIDENEKRERTVWIRDFDESLPRLNKYYNNDGDGNENIYNEYRYEGNLDDLHQLYDSMPTRKIPMTDSYF